jgi:hypothetical protein
MQVKTMLVRCGFSDSAGYAFTWALEMAEKWGAKVVVVNAAPMFSHPWSIRATTSPWVMDEFRKQPIHFLRQALYREGWPRFLVCHDFYPLLTATRSERHSAAQSVRNGRRVSGPVPRHCRAAYAPAHSGRGCR